MPHKRSQKAMRKRLARRIILATSFYDREQAENISRVNITYVDQVEEHPLKVASYYRPWKPANVKVEQGEVLADKRGRGTLQ